jgi:hypothetical protein
VIVPLFSEEQRPVSKTTRRRETSSKRVVRHTYKHVRQRWCWAMTRWCYLWHQPHWHGERAADYQVCIHLALVAAKQRWRSPAPSGTTRRLLDPAGDNEVQVPKVAPLLAEWCWECRNGECARTELSHCSVSGAA